MQGYVTWAHYASLGCRVSKKSLDANVLEAEAAAHLAKARALCKVYSENNDQYTMDMDEALEDKFFDLRTGGQVHKVQNAVSITGLPSLNTGTWLRCANGHPFTTGAEDVGEDDAVCYYCGEGLAKEGLVNENRTEDGSVQEVDGAGEPLNGL